MIDVQLYIEDQRVDLFTDETIEIVSKIQDVKDISKVFTEFSKRFNIPASVNNNKIFKHYYNYDITVNNYDGRKRHSAKIFLNHSLFKNGLVFLNSVKMKHNKAYSYNVTFFGNTVSITDLFSEDNLSSLYDYQGQTLGLNNFDHDITFSNVKTIFEGTGLTVNGDNSALIYPLITPKKRLFYDSSLGDADAGNFDGNIYAPSSGYNTSQYRTRGVKPQDLKPAIKVYHIIKAIQEKYNINFIPDDTSGTHDFFSKENEAFSNLYLWMSNKKGNNENKKDDDDLLFTKIIDDDFTSPDDYSLATQSETIGLAVDADNSLIPFSVENNKSTLTFTATEQYQQNPSDYHIAVDTDVDTGDEDIEYRVILEDLISGKDYVIASGKGRLIIQRALEIPSTLELNQTLQYRVKFKAASSMTITDFKIGVNQASNQQGTLDSQRNFLIRSSDIAIDAKKFDAATQIPEIKIIDLIKGLFKMFNLTAYYIDDETDPEFSATTPVIKVTTLDNFYADAINNKSGGIFDITKYIEVKEHDVTTSVPFSEIDFQFEATNTVLMENHKETFNEVFGNSHFNIKRNYPDIFSGQPYEIKVPFSHLKYERLFDLSDDSLTEIQWGYSAGGDFKATDDTPPKGDYDSKEIKPLLFYGVRETSISQNINFSNNLSTDNDIVNDYYRPSNTNESGSITNQPSFSLNFDLEQDEFSPEESYLVANSLFETYYKSYIQTVFDREKRLFTFFCYLPQNILIDYKLNDQLKIHDRVFRINSITVNVNTGKTKLELINLNQSEIVS